MTACPRCEDGELAFTPAHHDGYTPPEPSHWSCNSCDFWEEGWEDDYTEGYEDE